MRPGLYRAFRDRVVRPLFRLLYRIRVEGGENVPAHGPAIVVANHESLIDPLALALVTTRPLRFFAKRELWERWWLAPLLQALGGIRVERWRGAPATIARGEALLRAGEVLAVFPDGRIRRDGGRWEHGAARLALATGAPLVPVRIVGSADALRRWKIGFPRVRLVVGEPIGVTPERPTARRERALIQQAAESVAALSTGRSTRS
jgi:1-acyl-sn-glycerol-3-phosphate acyltransferase